MPFQGALTTPKSRQLESRQQLPVLVAVGAVGNRLANRGLMFGTKRPSIHRTLEDIRQAVCDAEAPSRAKKAPACISTDGIDLQGLRFAHLVRLR